MSVKDGLSAISNEVLGDVQKEAEAIILSAENEAKETLKNAKHQADQNYQTMINQATTKADGEKRKITSVTEVDMRNRILQAKEELVDVAFEKALDKIKDFAVSDDYHSFLLKLIETVAKQIDRKELALQVNSNDKTWLTQETLIRLSKKINCKLSILDETEDYIGGFKIQTPDGKITYDSTLDNRLRELKPVLRVEVAKTMFEKEEM